MATTTATQEGRIEFNRRGFQNLSQTELIEKARKFNDQRILRAAGAVGQYRMIGSEGQILNFATGATYECADVRRWEALPGTVMFVGCDCEDEVCRLAPLRAAMQAKGCGSPVQCKHFYLRMLYTGATLRTTTGLKIKIKGSILNKSNEDTVTE